MVNKPYCITEATIKITQQNVHQKSFSFHSHITVGVIIQTAYSRLTSVPSTADEQEVWLLSPGHLMITTKHFPR